MQTFTSPPQVPLTDAQIFEQLIEKSSKEQLDELSKAIDEEKELRRLKDSKLIRLRKEMNDEKQKISAGLQKLRSKMAQMKEAVEDEEESEQEDEPVKKVVRKRKAK